MGDYDTPEQMEQRKSVFAKFARLQVIKEEKRRARVQLANPTMLPGSQHYNTWRTDEEKREYQSKQLEYIIPYTEEYKSGPRTVPQASETSESLFDDSSSIAPSETTTSTTTVVTNPDNVVNQLKLLRNRPRIGRRPNLAPGGAEMADEVCKVSGLGAEINQTTNSFPNPPPAPSTYNFEATSTILPPTEVGNNDQRSNVSLEELKETYFKNYKTNRDLPIHKQRKQIVDSINSYKVVIIEGATGCGKTTQVPTYILEDAILERPSDKSPVIYVTQPRRIAARSIAERVCSEHNWDMASIVGYQVGLDKVVGPQTVLVFCTAGVLLQKIIQEKSLAKYSHIIIDEAHERDADTDLLMMMIRKLMLTELSTFRLVIMSATMDIEKLKRYFTFRTNYGHQAETKPSYIHAGQSARSASNIQTVYLDTLRLSFNVCEQVPDFDIEQAELFEDCLRAAVKIIIEIIPRLDTFRETTKSTLVFLPGLAEISKLERMIKSYKGASDCLDIIPLHSCLAVKDQLRVFSQSPPGTRKVILATNIAESSITVTDVGFVVDFCLTKTIMKDTVTRFPTLKLMWSTQDKCTQRSGRTGRCCPGKVFRMVPQSFYRQLDEYAEPELLTAPLELSVLRVKNFQMGEIKALFAIVMDPPPFNEIRTAVLELKQIGALAATYLGELTDIDGDLTELGRIISTLPIDVHLSKLIVLASVFDVLDDAIIVAACLSTNRTIVRYLYGNLLATYDIKMGWARGSQSDLFLSLECYKEFKEYKEDRMKTQTWLESWCKKNCLDERKLHDVDAMVKEITARLENVNIFANQERPNQERDVNMDTLMLKIAFCAAFYPNYFLSMDLDQERIMKELNGCFDPTKTVFISGLPVSQVPIYKSQLLEQIGEEADKVEFVADNSRAYLVLEDGDNIHTQGLERVSEAVSESGKYKVIQESRAVSRQVYRALKLGDSEEIQIREYKDDVAIERMNFYHTQKETLAKMLGHKLIPSCMKVLPPGRSADNCRLIGADEDDYLQIIQTNPVFEVEFNTEQAKMDQKELQMLKDLEERNEKSYDHDIYKPNYKRVRGPDNPIRMSFRSVLYKSEGFTVEVDSMSVNSILLDPEYHESRRQMLVSATVTQSKNGRVVARDTTLMPSIRGLPTLMTLLFAQYYRLIYNNELNCLAGGVFGIGWTETDDLPLDRQYEVELGFDVHITMDDIALINQARRMMSQLLKFTEILNAGKPQAILQEDLRKVILVLMRRRRFPLRELDTSSVNYPESADNIFTKDSHNMSFDILPNGQTRPFLPLMKYSRNFSEGDLYDRIRANLEVLKKIEQDLEPIPDGGVKCLLCGNGYRCRFILGLNVENHVRSKDHLKKVAEFEIYEAQFRSRSE